MRDKSSDDPIEPAPSPKPPLLNYPSPPVEPNEIDTEPWPKIARAFATIFGVLLAIFVITGMLCGMLPHGCG